MTTHLLRPRYLLPIALLFAACNDNGTDGVDSVSPPPIPASDRDYIDNLVPHHEMALQMADAEIANGADSNVKAMAQRMKEAQQEEISMLRAIRERVAGSDTIAAIRDPHVNADIADLQLTTGSAADVMFLENMIPHHAGAVSLSHRALDNLSDAELIDMANKTIVVQTREMNEMLDMLGR